MPAVQDFRALSQVALFEGLAEDELENLNELLRSRTFEPGSNIITVAQPGEVVYILLDGTVKIYVDQFSCHVAGEWQF